MVWCPGSPMAPSGFRIPESISQSVIRGLFLPVSQSITDMAAKSAKPRNVCRMLGS